MTWTGYWGKQFADVWNRFPAAMWNDVPTSDMQAGSLNSASRQQVPWPLENTRCRARSRRRPTPMPSIAGIPPRPGTRCRWTCRCRRASLCKGWWISPGERGVAAGYGIALPSGMEGVYTISVFPDDPRHDATLHIDQYSGKVLADVRWQDYNAVARSVQMGVVLHEGKLFGLGNQLLMLAVCLAILLSSASGLWIWWKRKPAGRLGAAAAPRAAALEERHRHHAGAGRGLPAGGGLAPAGLGAGLAGAVAAAGGSPGPGLRPAARRSVEVELAGLPECRQQQHAEQRLGAEPEEGG
ncbi:PepSY domain-containing protein [Pseudomonas aeruginosa]|nr:PepSY domain-containing protein [Pseudomonas aeruginosa]